MEWTREHEPADCAKCEKTIIKGRWLGREGQLNYCYRCGTNLELVQVYRYSRELTMPKF